MDITTQDISAFLARAWQRAGDAANTLPDQLESERQAALDMIAPLGSISSVSKNSTSQASGGYNPGNLTLRQIVSIWTDLIARYNRIQAKIVELAACASPAVDLTGFDFDGPVYTQMVNQLSIEADASGVPDISMIRFGYVRREQFPQFAAA